MFQNPVWMQNIFGSLRKYHGFTDKFGFRKLYCETYIRFGVLETPFRTSLFSEPYFCVTLVLKTT
jgi:hypothetical protein